MGYLGLRGFFESRIFLRATNCFKTKNHYNQGTNFSSLA